MRSETPSIEKNAFFQADDTLQMPSRRFSPAPLPHILAQQAQQARQRAHFRFIVFLSEQVWIWTDNPPARRALDRFAPKVG